MTDKSPITSNKEPDEASVFQPENLLREARRQLEIPEGEIPEICVLDPDGDIVRNLLETERCSPNSHWACYHTDLYNCEMDGIDFGIVGCAVGAPFAVLVAEQMFASGCELLISITSAGKIQPVDSLPCFVAIKEALRDEGTSYHYRPASKYCGIKDSCLEVVKQAADEFQTPVYYGSTWTTSAPFRETESAIEYARAENILAVEMEAAALYAFSAARDEDVICFAHVTNEMGKESGDFEKGVAAGSRDALEIILNTARTWLDNQN